MSAHIGKADDTYVQVNLSGAGCFASAKGTEKGYWILYKNKTDIGRIEGGASKKILIPLELRAGTTEVDITVVSSKAGSLANKIKITVEKEN